MMEMPVKLSQNSDGLIKLKGQEGKRKTRMCKWSASTYDTAPIIML